MRERDIQRKVCAYLISKGGRIGRMSGVRGIPDRLFILPTGETLMVEFKTLRGRLSPIQQAYHRKLLKQSHPIAVVRTVQQGIDIINSYD